MLRRRKSNLRSETMRSGFPLFAVALGLWSSVDVRGGQRANSETLPPAQLVEPGAFAHELVTSSAAPRPTIVYVGVHTLFNGGHIPGATFHGTGSTEQGLLELKKWASALSRTTNIVIYCGCCPFERCPNIRPAFFQFRDLGFTQLRVLHLPTSFAEDWAAKNFPMEVVVH